MKLPKIYVNKNVVSNNKKISYEKINNFDSLDNKINEIINTVNNNTLIEYDNKSEYHTIIGRTKNKIVTKDGIIIDINKIKNITLQR